MTEYFSKPQDGEPAPSSQENFDTLPVDRLPETLGFIETEEMCELRSEYVKAKLSTEPVTARKLAERYHVLGQQIAEQYQGEAYTQAQIGLMVALSLLRRDAGAIELYLEDLDDAATYAHNLGYDNIVDSLEAGIGEFHNRSKES